MGRQKKVSKPKEPVRIRQRKLKNGNISLYLDIYSDGVRKYESLSLYLVPEKDPISKDQNRHAMQVANKVKSERILGLQNRGIKQWEKIKQENMPLLTWLCKYEQSDGNFAKSTLKGRKEMRHKIEQYLATTGDINICLSEIDVDFCRGFVKFLKTAHHGVKKDATAVISQGCAHHHQVPFSLDPKDRIEWHFSLHNESILSLDDILVKSFQPFVPHLYQNTLLLVHKT